ncbi:hypothetical protein FACS1894187_24310 [Synergistales bacterium]|nr:hypothetical protein FACS1894187_24310 [Synergistales bacterium]
MTRPINPNSQYRVKPHTTNGYTYASTQPPYVNPETGKKKYRYIHWGTLDEAMKFIPGSRYVLASPEERAKLVFPDGWDMSEVGKLSGARKPGRPAYEAGDTNCLYGDIWLLEQVALKTSIRQDLEKVFDGNKEMVDDILTLAMFPYITKYNYSRVVRWQRLVKAPSNRELTPAHITRLTQSVTEKHRMDLLRLRAARLGPGEVCAVDSTSRCACGHSLADIKWGKNKERLPLEQTVEVVVYSLASHMPVYYRTFPGNIPDSRSLETILADLDHAGFSNIILVTDRGYESIRNLESYILRGQAMVMCTKTQQKHVLSKIEDLGEFSARPASMSIDPETRIYHRQYDIEYEVQSKGRAIKKADRLKLCLYFDSIRRSEELVQLDIDIHKQEISLAKMLKEKAVLDDDNTLKRHYCYFNISYNQTTRAIESYDLNKKKVTKARKMSGFFSITTHKLNFSAMAIFEIYRLRDEQEKYFQQMKDQMVSDRQRNWSEEGKTGRLFILFVSLILSSYVRYVWKSTELFEHFTSSLEVLDEMRPIRCIEHTNKAKFITPFVGDQVGICRAFGFDIPEGCSPDYVSKQTFTHRRGRPPKKKTVEHDL